MATSIKASAKTRQILSLINQAGSQFVSVTFIKKDGTERTIRFNPKYSRLTKDPSERAKKAAETRKLNNPDLLNVMDIDLRQQGTEELRCWRTISTSTVKRIAIGGVVYEIK